MEPRPEKRRRLSEAEAHAREERLKKAGLTCRRETTSMITTLRKRAIEEGREDDDGRDAVE